MKFLILTVFLTTIKINNVWVNKIHSRIKRENITLHTSIKKGQSMCCNYALGLGTILIKRA